MVCSQSATCLNAVAWEQAMVYHQSATCLNAVDWGAGNGLPSEYHMS